MFFFPRKLSTFSHLLHRAHVSRVHRTGLCSKNSHVLSEPTTGAHQHADQTRLLLLAGFLQLINELPGFSEV